MRILDRLKISYEVLSYQCDEFIDGIHTADTLGIPHENCFKTLVLQGKSKGYSVFVLPIEEELNLKECAKAVNEKSVEMIHVKDINAVTGYIRGCCTALGMKKEYPTIIHESALDCPLYMRQCRKAWSSAKAFTAGFYQGDRCKSTEYYS